MKRTFPSSVLSLLIWRKALLYRDIEEQLLTEKNKLEPWWNFNDLDKFASQFINYSDTEKGKMYWAFLEKVNYENIGHVNYEDLDEQEIRRFKTDDVYPFNLNINNVDRTFYFKIIKFVECNKLICAFVSVYHKSGSLINTWLNPIVIPLDLLVDKPFKYNNKYEHGENRKQPRF